MTFSWNGIILQVDNVTEKEENAGKSTAGIFRDWFALMFTSQSTFFQSCQDDYPSSRAEPEYEAADKVSCFRTQNM